MRKIGLATAVLGAGLMASGVGAHAQVFFSITESLTGTNISPSGNPAHINPDNAGTGMFIDYAGQVLGGATPGQATGLGQAVNIGSFTPNILLNSVSTTASFSNAFTLAFTLTRVNSDGSAFAGALGASNSVTGSFSGTLTATTDNVSYTTPGYVAAVGSGTVFDLLSGGQHFFLQLTGEGQMGDPQAAAPPNGATGNFSARVFSVNPLATPEPGTWAMLLGMGTTGMTIAYRRRRRKV